MTNCSVRFVIGLRNSDGHVSEIRASLPAALVLPPYVSSRGTTPHIEDSTVNHLSYLEVNGDSLPTYESRIYDRLWDGISCSGLDTSALNTPINLSRRASAENLRELNSLSMPNPGDLAAGLRQALRERNEDPEPSHEHSSESLISLGAAPNPLPARSPYSTQMTMTPLNGDEEHPRLTPTSSPEMQHVSPTLSHSSDERIDMGRLSRVPSYNTANSSNILNLDPINNALPTYANAMATIPERESAGHSPEERPVARTQNSSREGGAAIRTGGQVGNVYGTPQTFDDPMRRILMMRFSSNRR
jgi:arrestin-related trafficking adapter 4/5/7